MGHRLRNWWNPNNLWHRAAALAALKVYGAVFRIADAVVEDDVVGDQGCWRTPGRGDISAG